MTLLQQEVSEKIKKLSPDDLEILLRFINEYMVSDHAHKKRREIGVFKGQDLYAADYDLDELNDEIADMFGVME